MMSVLNSQLDMTSEKSNENPEEISSGRNFYHFLLLAKRRFLHFFRFSVAFLDSLLSQSWDFRVKNEIFRVKKSQNFDVIIHVIMTLYHVV